MGIRGVRARPALIAQEMFGLELERLPVNGLDLRVGANPELGLSLHVCLSFPRRQVGLVVTTTLDGGCYTVSVPTPFPKTRLLSVCHRLSATVTKRAQHPPSAQGGQGGGKCPRQSRSLASEAGLDKSVPFH